MITVISIENLRKELRDKDKEIQRMKDCIKDSTVYLKVLRDKGKVESITYLNLVIEDNELYLK
jgi:hypothetical protein